MGNPSANKKIAPNVIKAAQLQLDRTKENKLLRPTIEAYGELESAFDFYNEFLFVRTFNVRLKNVMLTMPKHRRYQGYFQHKSWNSINNHHAYASEIALNPNFFNSPQEVCQTLVHEMVHLAQAEHPEIFGKPSPRNYHNKRFAQSMITIGLMPSSTGKPGGKMTGVGMSDYVIEDGQFAHAYEQFIKNGYEIRWSSSFVRNNTSNIDITNPLSSQDAVHDQKRRSKTKYSCNTCGLNAWAKPQVQLACVTCSTLMQEAHK